MIESIPAQHGKASAMLSIRYFQGRTYVTAIRPCYGPYGQRRVDSIPGIPNPFEPAELTSAIHTATYPLFRAPVVCECGRWVGEFAAGEVWECECGKNYVTG
jgi:hypothetical protein